MSGKRCKAFTCGQRARFEARCRCCWKGKRRASLDAAWADAKAHDPEFPHRWSVKETAA